MGVSVACYNYCRSDGMLGGVFHGLRCRVVEWFALFAGWCWAALQHSTAGECAALQQNAHAILRMVLHTGTYGHAACTYELRRALYAFAVAGAQRCSPV
jgi:hypothetical protein